MSSKESGADPSSWHSIIRHPVINKLLWYQIFSAFSSGIYSILIMFFIEYLPGQTGEHTSYALFYLISNITLSLLLLPGGGLCDRIGRRKVLRIGVVLLALSGLVAPLATQVWHLLIASFVSSAGLAFISPAQLSLVADISRGYGRQKSYGIITFASVICTGFGTLALLLYGELLGSVLNLEIYYRLMLSISAALGVVSAIPIFLIKESPVLGPNHVNKPVKEDSFSIRQNNVVSKMIFCNVLIGFGAGFIIPMFTYFFYDVFGLSQTTVYAINLLGGIGIAIGSLSAPWLARRAKRLGGRVGTIVTCQAASIVCAAYLLVVPWQMNLTLAVIAYAARQDLMNMISPLTSSLLMDHSPENRRGIINSLISIAFNVPNGISPYFTSIILGLVPPPYGYSYSILALVVLYSIATFIYATTRKADRRLLMEQSKLQERKRASF